MKSSRRSFAPVAAGIALLVLGLLGPGISHGAPDEATLHRNATEDLLKAMKLEQLMGEAVERMAAGCDRMIDNASRAATAAPADQLALQQKMRADTRDLLAKEFGWDVLKPEFLQVYSDEFTTAELKDLIAFYQTPTGQKFITRQSELTTRLGKITQQHSLTVTARISQRVRELAAAARPPGAGPTPTPAASAIPLGPTVPVGPATPTTPTPGASGR